MNWMIATIGLTLLYIVANVVFTIWVTIGGWFDLMQLLTDLEREQVDVTDDGRVI